MPLTTSTILELEFSKGKYVFYCTHFPILINLLKAGGKYNVGEVRGSDIKPKLFSIQSAKTIWVSHAQVFVLFMGQYRHAYRLVLMFLDICQYALFLTNLFLFYSVCKQSLWDGALQVKSNGEEIYETELSEGNFLKTVFPSL